MDIDWGSQRIPSDPTEQSAHWIVKWIERNHLLPCPGSTENTYPKVKTLANKRFVDNGKFVTSASLSSGIDAALYLVAQDLGIEKAKSIATQIEYDWYPEKGYVRGNMADSQLASISKKLLEFINSEPIYAYGSETEWFASYSLNNAALDGDSEAAQKKLLWQLRQHMSGHWIKAPGVKKEMAIKNGYWPSPIPCQPRKPWR